MAVVPVIYLFTQISPLVSRQQAVLVGLLSRLLQGC
jgi:hypothetical protein